MVTLLLVLLFTSSAAKADMLMIDDTACHAIVRHVPDAGVEYKPGVDVRGKPVVEADLNPSPVKLPEIIRFDLTADVLKHAGMTPPEGLEGKAVVGQVEIRKDGKMFFDGQPMEGEAEAALQSLCADKIAKKQGANAAHGGLQKRPRDAYNR